MLIAIDFDGTIVEDHYPNIGPLRKNAAKVINRLQEEGHQIIIWTCRTNTEDIHRFLRVNRIDFDRINENCPYRINYYKGTDPRKLGADMYIDDKQLGGIPEDWEDIYQMISSSNHKLPKYEKPVIKIVNISDNPLPEYLTESSSGFDIRAYIPESVELSPGERKIIGTGLYFQIPEGYELQIRPRSGLAIKEGLTVLNTPGTVDADYRGEVKVILYNASHPESGKVIRINTGERIAQGVIVPVRQAEFEQVTQLDLTVRGSGGFGSTGKN
jgi:dUTP pyrophosphatase